MFWFRRPLSGLICNIGGQGKRGNESPQTIQTSQPGNFSGEGGPLWFTQQKITVTQLGLRLHHKTTHTHTDFKTIPSKRKQTWDCLQSEECHFDPLCQRDRGREESVSVLLSWQQWEASFFLCYPVCHRSICCKGNTKNISLKKRFFCQNTPSGFH